MEKEPVADGTSTYARDPDGDLVGLGTPGGAWTPLTDTHGDVVAAFPTSGTGLTDQKVFDPFGVTTSAGSANVRVGFQGSWTDPVTAKVSAEARWYTPDTGGFVSRDSIDLPVSGSAGGSRYLYADANPLVFNDPSGHSPLALLLVPLAEILPPVAAATAIVVVGGATLYYGHELYQSMRDRTDRSAAAGAVASATTVSGVDLYIPGLVPAGFSPYVGVPVASGVGLVAGGGGGGSSSRVDGRVSSMAGRSPQVRSQVRSRLPVPALPAPRVKPVPPAGPAWSGPSTIAPPDGWSAAGEQYVPQECVPGTCADSLPSGDGASGQGTDGGCGLAEGSLPLAATCVPDEPDPDPAAAGGAGRPPR